MRNYTTLHEKAALSSKGQVELEVKNRCIEQFFGRAKRDNGEPMPVSDIDQAIAGAVDEMNK